MSEKTPEQTTLCPRHISREILDEFLGWTRTAPMFLSSPEGRVFGEEMRSVICLAYEALENRDAT